MVERQRSFSDGSVENNHIPRERCTATAACDGKGSLSREQEEASRREEVDVVESMKDGVSSTNSTTAASSLPDLAVSSLTKSNPVSPVTCCPRNAYCVWSDEDVASTALTLLRKDGALVNVLDLRRRWNRPSVPDPRQWNRVLYRLRDAGEIEMLPPNGTSQKPCWRLLRKSNKDSIA